MELASLDLATLSVVQAMYKLRDGSIRFSGPKTVKSRRMVALSPTAVLALREHREKQEALADADGSPSLCLMKAIASFSRKQL